VLGGSTNAVLHLLAMARAVNIPFSLADIQEASDRVPFLGKSYSFIFLNIYSKKPKFIYFLLYFMPFLGESDNYMILYSKKKIIYFLLYFMPFLGKSDKTEREHTLCETS
jgi:hypothetical protein